MCVVSPWMLLGFREFCDLVAQHVHRRIAAAVYEPPADDDGPARIGHEGASATIIREPSRYWCCTFEPRARDAPIAEKSGYRFDNYEASRLAIAIVDMIDPTVMPAIKASVPEAVEIGRSFGAGARFEPLASETSAAPLRSPRSP